MKRLRRAIVGLAFTAALALSLVASTGNAFAAQTPDTHGVTIARGNGGTTLTPFDALGITWE